jgi:triosephosphate isomerase (TIM)
MPNRYAVANWKMNLPPEGIDPYLRALESAPAGAKPVVAPPFVYVDNVAKIARHVAVAAQNCGDRVSGAFTGEVSAQMLRDVGVTFVIVGHSERRNVYREDDALVGRRLAMAIDHGLTPVLCIGEDLRTRDAGEVTRFLADQIHAVVSDSLKKAKEVVIAYEPIWAIGTGRNATGALCAETVGAIRAAVRYSWPATLHDGPVLYGGSVTPDNVADLVANGAIDGFLVGGASLDSKKFLAIHAALSPA